jgi:intracellular multiplication protein IcmC
MTVSQRLWPLIKCTCLVGMMFTLTGCKELSMAAVNNLGQILSNLEQQLPAVWRMLIALSYVMGIGFTLIGLFRLKKYGQQTVMMMAAANIGEPMIFLFVGIALFYLPTMMNSMVETFWGYGLSGIQAYTMTTSAGPTWDQVINPLMRVVQIIGLIAFMRGLTLLTRMAGQSQPGVLSKAFVHIIGGIMAINIYGTIDIRNQTLF